MRLKKIFWKIFYSAIFRLMKQTLWVIQPLLLSSPSTQRNSLLLDVNHRWQQREAIPFPLRENHFLKAITAKPHPLSCAEKVMCITQRWLFWCNVNCWRSSSYLGLIWQNYHIKKNFYKFAQIGLFFPYHFLGSDLFLISSPSIAF